MSGFPPGQGGGGIFTDRCQFSHEPTDDPILMPGMTGQSMQHDFFGNTMTSAYSTASTLAGKPATRCTSADASAYWTPVLYQNGQPLQSASALIYWRQGKALAAIAQPMPAGISLIAGNEQATVYLVAGRCPASHPVAIPQIVLHVNYPTSSAAGLTLSMSPTMQGSTDTAHADFINGRDQALMARDTGACIAGCLR